MWAELPRAFFTRKCFKKLGLTYLRLLNKPGMLDDDNDDIIDELPLDYSILEEITYQYSTCNAYLSYTTHGCPRKCAFCAVPRLEPKYMDYVG